MEPFNSLPKPTTLFQKPRTGSLNFSDGSTTDFPIQDDPLSKSMTFFAPRVQRSAELRSSDLVVPQPRKIQMPSSNFPQPKPNFSDMFRPPIDSNPNFYHDLQQQAHNIDEINKYVQIGDGEGVGPGINKEYVESVLKNYQNVLGTNEQGKGTFMAKLARQSFGGVSPMLFQFHKISNSYINRKLRGKGSIVSSDEEGEFLGPISKAERRRKIEAWKQKKESRSTSNLPRYGIRRKLAQKRERHHGRFVKSKKKSISELAKAFKSESMTNSVYSNVSSRKGSISGLIIPMSKLSLSEVHNQNQGLAFSGGVNQHT